MSANLAKDRVEQNRRVTNRGRVLVGGLIVCPIGSAVLECTVYDSSESGAKIRVSDERRIPSEFYFVNLKRQNAYNTQLIWRRSHFAGLSLRDAHALDEPLPEEMENVYRPFVRAKLRQIGTLIRNGHSLEECLSFTGVDRLTYERWRRADRS